MRALLLAAGEGTRLRPLTHDRPKPMLPVGGRPVLEHLVGLLRRHGIREIAINLHHAPDVIVDHFGDGARFGVRITYSREPTLLGSAGAARQLDWYLQDTFLVLYGDVLTDLNLSALVEHHRARGAVATLALYEVEDPTRCGIVALGDDDRIERFVEKPSAADAVGNLANAGVYVLEPGVLADVPHGRAHDFGHDVFPRLLDAGQPLYGWRTDGYVLDIGSPARYARAEADFQAGCYQPEADATAFRWYVARTKPRAERLAAMAIESRGLRTYLPEWRYRRPRGESEREPLFPCYLFFRTDGRTDALLRARAAPNVVRLLGNGLGPEAVPDDLVTEIRDRCERQSRAPLAPGQKVRIRSGPFRELDAIFDAPCSGGTRARVFVQLLNRLVLVTLEADALRPAM